MTHEASHSYQLPLGNDGHPLDYSPEITAAVAYHMQGALDDYVAGKVAKREQQVESTTADALELAAITATPQNERSKRDADRLEEVAGQLPQAVATEAAKAGKVMGAREGVYAKAQEKIAKLETQLEARRGRATRLGADDTGIARLEERISDLKRSLDVNLDQEQRKVERSKSKIADAVHAAYPAYDETKEDARLTDVDPFDFWGVEDKPAPAAPTPPPAPRPAAKAEAAMKVTEAATSDSDEPARPAGPVAKAKAPKRDEEQNPKPVLVNDLDDRPPVPTPVEHDGTAAARPSSGARRKALGMDEPVPAEPGLVTPVGEDPAPVAPTLEHGDDEVDHPEPLPASGSDFTDDDLDPAEPIVWGGEPDDEYDWSPDGTQAVRRGMPRPWEASNADAADDEWDVPSFLRDPRPTADDDFADRLRDARHGVPGAEDLPDRDGESHHLGDWYDDVSDDIPAGVSDDSELSSDGPAPHHEPDPTVLGPETHPADPAHDPRLSPEMRNRLGRIDVAAPPSGDNQTGEAGSTPEAGTAPAGASTEATSTPAAEADGREAQPRRNGRLARWGRAIMSAASGMGAGPRAYLSLGEFINPSMAAPRAPRPEGGGPAPTPRPARPATEAPRRATAAPAEPVAPTPAPIETIAAPAPAAEAERLGDPSEVVNNAVRGLQRLYRAAGTEAAREQVGSSSEAKAEMERITGVIQDMYQVDPVAAVETRARIADLLRSFRAGEGLNARLGDEDEDLATA